MQTHHYKPQRHRNPALDCYSLLQDPTLEELPRSRQELRSLYRNLQREFQRRTVVLASAAHEIKTPLAILAGYADLLLDGKLGRLTPRQKEVIQEMQTTRMRLQRFVEDFLNYSAISTGKVKLRIEPHDLNECLRELYEVWMPRFREKMVAFYLLPADALELFPFDYFKIQHIISNLLHNALNYTPPKGTVWLSAERNHWERRNARTKVKKERRNAENASSNSVRISVSDTGTGISPEFHSEIFEDFSRLNRSSERAAGFGLGLPVARSLVHAHGGHIWVETNSSGGAKFCVLLPLTQEKDGLE